MGRKVDATGATGRLLKGLGLAARAGRVRLGVEAVSRAIRRRQAAAVLVAGDAPGSVKGRLEGLLSSSQVPHRIVLDGDRLGRAVGRERVIALAVTDRSLARRVLEWADAVEG